MSIRPMGTPASALSGTYVPVRWPRPIAQLSLDNLAAVTGLTVYDEAGDTTSVAAGDDTGLPWLIYSAAGHIYLATDARVGFDVSINRSDVSFGGRLLVFYDGWGGLTLSLPVDGPTNMLAQGSLNGVPPLWASGGPAAESGFDQLQTLVDGNIISDAMLNLYLLD